MAVNNLCWVLVFAGLSLVIALILQSFNYYKLDKKLLIVGVLSSRHHFAKRNAIRQSWGKFIHSDIKIIFIVDAEDCHLDHSLRLSPYSCERWNVDYKELRSTEPWTTILDVTDSSKNINNEFKQFLPITSLGFKVRHSVIMQAVGIKDELLEALTSVSLLLKDHTEVVEKVQFTHELCTRRSNGFCLINLRHQIILPQQFEGEIVLDIESQEFDLQELYLDKKWNSCNWIDGGHSIVYTFIITNGAHAKWSPEVCPVFVVEFTNINLSSKTANEEDLQEAWMIRSKIIEEKLSTEVAANDDVVVIPGVDVYSNLPLKLINLFKWISSNYHPDYVLKADDDTYVNLTMILDLLSNNLTLNLRDKCGSSLVCWGHFHYNRAVPLFGKWADYEYPGIAYPTFPSGAAYLLSGDLVNVLAAAGDGLKRYKGEDVCMGVWMSAITKSFNYHQTNKIFDKLINLFNFYSDNCQEFDDNELTEKVEVPCWLPSQGCDETYVVSQVDEDQMIVINSND